MGQSSQYNQRDKTKALHRDPVTLHTKAHYDGVDSSVQKQTGTGPQLQKREIPEPDQRDAGFKAVVMPIDVCARGFIGSSVSDLLTKLSISVNKRTKALKLLAEIVGNSSHWIWSSLLHND